MATITETADASSDTNTAYAMAVGDVFYGSMSPLATDWVEIRLVAGRTYTIGAVGLGAAGSGVTDPFLRLRAANGAILDSDDDAGPGFTASLTFTASTTGSYFIEAKAQEGAADGAYAIAVTAGADLSLGVDLGAAVLYRDGGSWAASPDTAVTLTWGVRSTGPAFDAVGDAAPFQVLTAGQIAAARAAMANYSDIANVTFQQVNPGGTTANATILMGGYTSDSDASGAYAYYPGDRAPGDDAGDLWINNHHVSGTSLPVGSYDYFIFLHELGHAMGLAHPGDYNAAPGVTITYGNSAQFIEDSQQFSVMSYFDASATERDSPNSYADTLMMYDIYAIQQLYGVNHATRAGNDTYGFHSNLTGAYDFTVNTDPLMCIWDGGGIDTLDLSGFGGAQRVDLNGGAFSSVGGYTDNLSIAVGAVIEHAIGGRGADEIHGNGAANWLRGGRGDDVLTGGRGADRLSGNLGADGFVFEDGFGRDRITDFNTDQDVLILSADLWGNAALTAAQVLADFAVMRAGSLVLDFGVDQVTLLNVTSATGLDTQIQID